MLELTQISDALESLGKEINPKEGKGVYEAYYEAKTDFENIDEQKKSMLAFYEMMFLDQKTQAEIGRNALACQEYKEFIDGLNEARRRMNQAFAKLKSVEARLDIYRSLNKHLSITDKI